MNGFIPKLVMLISGERLVANVREVTADDGRGICLVLKRPYILNIYSTEDTNSTKYSINFSKWQPYSTDEEYNIPYFSVITVADLDPEILTTYLKKFGDDLNDNNTVPTSDSSDTVEESGVPDSTD